MGTWVPVIPVVVGSLGAGGDKKAIYHRHEVGHYWIVDPEQETLAVNRRHPEGYLEILTAERGQRVRAAPFDAIEWPLGILFGDDEEE